VTSNVGTAALVECVDNGSTITVDFQVLGPLGDFIDNTTDVCNPTWKDMQLTVEVELPDTTTVSETSAPEKWWDNPVVAFEDTVPLELTGGLAPGDNPVIVQHDGSCGPISMSGPAFADAPLSILSYQAPPMYFDDSLTLGASVYMEGGFEFTFGTVDQGLINIYGPGSSLKSIDLIGSGAPLSAEIYIGDLATNTTIEDVTFANPVFGGSSVRIADPGANVSGILVLDTDGSHPLQRLEIDANNTSGEPSTFPIGYPRILAQNLMVLDPNENAVVLAGPDVLLRNVQSSGGLQIGAATSAVGAARRPSIVTGSNFESIASAASALADPMVFHNIQILSAGSTNKFPKNAVFSRVYVQNQPTGGDPPYQNVSVVVGEGNIVQGMSVQTVDNAGCCYPTVVATEPNGTWGPKLSSVWVEGDPGGVSGLFSASAQSTPTPGTGGQIEAWNMILNGTYPATTGSEFTWGAETGLIAGELYVSQTDLSGTCNTVAVTDPDFPMNVSANVCVSNDPSLLTINGIIPDNLTDFPSLTGPGSQTWVPYLQGNVPPPGSVCGDGVVYTTEICDDGETTANCNRDCTLSSCGDGFLNVLDGEECDDGDTVPGDGCGSTCLRETCGDSTIDPGEECDDGGPSSTCNTLCMFKTCGNYVVEFDPGLEECDDGPTGSLTCTSDCLLRPTPVITRERTHAFHDGDWMTSQAACDTFLSESTFSGSAECQVTWLVGAYEKLLDVDASGQVVGNENGLCESNETCELLTEIGYHTDGTPVTYVFNGNSLTNVTLVNPLP
jgi:cysteine-rich repeat protein